LARVVRGTGDCPRVVQQQLMTATGDRDPFFLSWAYHTLARLTYEWNDLAATQHALDQAQALGADPNAGIHVLTSGGLIRVRLLQRQGAIGEALHLLAVWEQQARFPCHRQVVCG
jgi:LuxR family transcriptional regulator, maltose regulon positive regulatory protein